MSATGPIAADLLDLAEALGELAATGCPFVLARSWIEPAAGYVCWIGRPGERGRVPHGLPFCGDSLPGAIRAAAAHAPSSSGRDRSNSTSPPDGSEQ